MNFLKHYLRLIRNNSQLPLWVKQFTVIVLSFITVESSLAQVSWLIQGGGMYKKQYGTGEIWDYNSDGERVPVKGSAGEGLIGLYLRIPVSKQRPFYIETGAGYRTKLVISQANDYKFDPIDLTSTYSEIDKYFDNYYGHFIEMPVKVGYEFPLKGKNSFLVGVGPTISWCSKKGKGDPWTAGINASVSFKHRSLNVGLSYSNPLFYNGLRDYFKNSINVTIGINFGIHIWNKIGNGMLVAASAMGDVSGAYLNANGVNSENINEYGSSGYTTFTESENTDVSDRSTGNGGNEKSENKKKYNISEQNAYNTDKRTYANYESMLIKAFLYPENYTASEVKGWQSKMKNLRVKWENRGKNFPRSSYESKKFKK